MDLHDKTYRLIGRGERIVEHLFSLNNLSRRLEDEGWLEEIEKSLDGIVQKLGEKVKALEKV